MSSGGAGDGNMGDENMDDENRESVPEQSPPENAPAGAHGEYPDSDPDRDTAGLVRAALAVTGRYLMAVALVLATICLVHSSTYKLETGHEGLLLRFGKYAYTEKAPGLHLKLPWPVDRVIQVKTGLVRSIVTDLHWPLEEAGAEELVPRVVLTGDKNVLECRFGVTYSVTDGHAYHLLVYHDAETDVCHADLIADALTCDALVQVMACRAIEGARTGQRGPIGMDVLRRVSDAVQVVAGGVAEKRGALPIGIGVDLNKSPGLSAVQVPADVRPAFEKVLTERIRVRTLESEAVRTGRQDEAQASAYREEKLQQAQATTQAVQREAEGDVAKFLGWHELIVKYREDDNPRTGDDLVWERVYRDTMIEIFKEFEEVIVLPPADRDAKERKRVRLHLLPAPR